MSHSTLALPASDRGWILCSGGIEIARNADLGALVGHRRDVLVAFPAACISTFVAELPPVEAALHESMIKAQVDKRGLSAKGPALIDFERIGGNERGDTFAVRVVAEPSPDIILPTAGGYETSAGLRGKASPGTEAMIWREHGRLILGVFISGIPAQVQILSGKPEVGKAIASEVNLILLGLRGESVFENSAPRELLLATDPVGEKEWIEFRSTLSIPVRSELPRFPAKAEDRPRLLPSAIVNHRRRRRNGVRSLALLAVGLVVYTVVGVWVWKDAKATEREMASLEQRIAIIEPDVERVQLVEERWSRLEPAFDKDLFPIVQLSRITAALPGSGVVIREYRTTGRDIRLRGQARDVQLANRLLEDLQGMNGFERYEWSMPNPRVERNNTATFEIQGKLKHEGTDA